jgi:hypothetical protein
MRPGSTEPATAWEAAPGRIGWSRVASGRPPVVIITGRSAEAMRDRPLPEEYLVALMGEDRFTGTFGGG